MEMNGEERGDADLKAAIDKAVQKILGISPNPEEQSKFYPTYYGTCSQWFDLSIICSGGVNGII